MSNIDADNDLLDRMIQAWFDGSYLSFQETRYDNMRRVLAVVREHDQQQAPALQRVPVYVSSHNGYTIIAACNDGTIHRGWWGAKGNFEWKDQLPPLPQPGDGA